MRKIKRTAGRVVAQAKEGSNESGSRLWIRESVRSASQMTGLISFPERSGGSGPLLFLNEHLSWLPTQKLLALLIDFCLSQFHFMLKRAGQIRSLRPRPGTRSSKKGFSLRRQMYRPIRGWSAPETCVCECCVNRSVARRFSRSSGASLCACGHGTIFGRHLSQIPERKQRRLSA